MTNPLVKEIIALLNEFPVAEISYEKDGVKVSATSGSDTYRAITNHTANAAPTVPQTAQLAPEKEEAPVFILSDRVGTFHLPSPSLRHGEQIQAGAVVGNIESIKILNEVIAHSGGRIVETLVDDGAPVEFGQPLYRFAAA